MFAHHGPVPQSPIRLIPDKSRTFPASLFENMRRILYQNACIALLENKTNGLSLSPFKLMLFTGSEIEMKNFTNPGIRLMED